jgi:hypothetical protein
MGCFGFRISRLALLVELVETALAEGFDKLNQPTDAIREPRDPDDWRGSFSLPPEAFIIGAVGGSADE